MKTPKILNGLIALVPLFLAMILCYTAKEFYPLSSFPMYSKFENRTYLVYLESPEGEPLPTISTISMPSSQLKKRYGAELNELKAKYKGSHFDWTTEQKQEAGAKTLEYLKNTFAPQAFENGKLDGIALVDVRLRVKSGRLETTEETVTRINP